MATPDGIKEIKQLFNQRQQEYKINKKEIHDELGNQFYNHDPTIPKFWLKIWDSYNRPYLDFLTRNGIKRGVFETTDFGQEKAEKAINVAIELDMLTEIPGQKYFPAIPKTKPEFYLHNAGSYVDADIWKDFWDTQSFSKTSVINKNQFDKACQDYFDEYNENEIRAIKEIGLTSNIISESDDGYIFVGVKK